MFRLIAALLLLSACNTAGPQFRGVPATRITIQGSTFDVRVRDNMAEAIRVNAQYAPRFGPIQERARLAMATVSGCKVAKVEGDQALATGRLKCGKSTPRRKPATQTIECTPLAGIKLAGAARPSVEVECTPA